MDNWDYSVFWQEAMKQFEEELSQQEYSMWFNITYNSSSQDTVNIGVPSVFFRDQLAKNYQKKIEEKLFELSGKRLLIDFLVLKPDDKASTKKSSGSDVTKTNNSTPQTAAILAQNSQKPLQTNKTPEKHPQMRQDFIFENYVVGENNSFAANAAMAIATNPGTAYNPFLIYGGVGLGKTHLMQAIGNRAWNLNPKLKIICVSSEDFTNDFIDAIHSNKLSAFKNRYRSVDILLVDDIHFFQNKEGFQDEMFYTFNALYDGNKQMVFTCDRPASELKNLTDRLRSRFERGLKVDLQPPNYETRYAILKKKTDISKINIPNDVIDIIARNVSTNIRDLESTLVTLGAYIDISKKEVSLDVAQQLLKDVFNQTRHGNVSIEHIIRAISDYFNVSSNDMKGKKRTQKIVFPRQVAMYIAREITEYSTTELGLEFGGRDHTTVMHSCQKIDERLKTDPTLEVTIQKLIQVIKQASIKT